MNHIDNQEVIVRDILSLNWEASYEPSEPYFDKLYAAAITNKPIYEIVASAQGGDSFDWDLTFKVIVGAIQMTTALVTLHTKWVETHGRKPTKAELTTEVENAKIAEAFPNPALAKRIDPIVEQLTK